MTYPNRQQAARQGAWAYLVSRNNLPNIPYNDMRETGMGLLVMPDAAGQYLDVLAEAFRFGVSPGVWFPDVGGETEDVYVERVRATIAAVNRQGLGPWMTVLNPEHNAIGKDPWKPGLAGPAPRWWTWMENTARKYRTLFPSRQTRVSIPAMQDYVNWPAIFNAGMDVSLQLYGADDGSVRFDPVEAFDRLKRNSYMDPADVDPRRVSFDVGCKHTDWYLEGATPRLAQAGLRGLSLWTIEEDVTQQDSSFLRYRDLIRNGVLALRAA